jgi:hypothetical protein
MRTTGIVALAAAGLGFLMCTDAGRQFRSRAGTLARQNYDQLKHRWETRKVRGMVEHATEEDHDTAMAHAFEDALATS